MQKPIPSTLRSSGCEEYEDDRGSSLLSAEMCEISENVEKPYELLFKIFAAVSGRTKNNLEPLLGKSSWDMLVGTLVTLKDRNREDKEQQIIMQ